MDFQYVADKPLIRDFNLEVKPEVKWWPLSDQPEQGKQPLINLLMRFYDVTAGSITVDGHDIRHLSRQDYRKQFEWCFRMLGYMKEPSKENLRFGNLKQRMKKLWKLKAANVDHFIRRFLVVYNMEMNQESSNISLGQKQLLTIARAL